MITLQALLVTPASQIVAEHGEGAVFDRRTQTLYWLDITNCKLFSLNADDEIKEICFESRISKIHPCGADEFIAWGQDIGVAKISISNGHVTVNKSFGNPLTHTSGLLTNDAGIDPLGRFFFGSMSLDGAPCASLYSLNDAGEFLEQLSGVTISNGVVWLEKGEECSLYFADSPTRQIRKYKYCLQTGTVLDAKNFEVTYEFPNGEFPDGMCIDSKGFIFAALWGAGKVVILDSIQRKIIGEIFVPKAINVSSCVFCEEDSKVEKSQTLYITTSKQGLSSKELEQYPNSGKLYCCKVAYASLIGQT